MLARERESFFSTFPLAVGFADSQIFHLQVSTPLPFPSLLLTQEREKKLCLDNNGFVHLLRHVNAYKTHAARATTGANARLLLGSLGSSGTDQRF